jgi:hypothetical protein
MTLGELLPKVFTLDEDDVVFAKRPFRRDSEAILVRFTADSAVPPDILAAGYEYFLEVSVMLEIFDPTTCHKLTDDELVEILLYYAEFDAYPEELAERYASEKWNAGRPMPWDEQKE